MFLNKTCTVPTLKTPNISSVEHGGAYFKPGTQEAKADLTLHLRPIYIEVPGQPGLLLQQNEAKQEKKKIKLIPAPGLKKNALFHAVCRKI